jgi:hypothetical protein
MSSYNANLCGTVLCTYGAKELDAVHWVHFCNCFPQGSICKTLTKKGPNAKLLPHAGESDCNNLTTKVVVLRKIKEKVHF